MRLETEKMVEKIIKWHKKTENRLFSGYFCVILCILCLFSSFSYGMTEGEAGEVLSFADHLFERTDYYRAITEYERFLFFQPESPRVPWVRYRIAESYLRGDQVEEAMLRFGELSGAYAGQPVGIAADFALARGYAAQDQYVEAIRQLDAIEQRVPSEVDRSDAALFKSVCQLRLRQPEEARNTLGGIQEGAPGALDAQWLLDETDRFGELPFKKPWVAGTLSAVLPGAGQVYAGRPRDGLAAFALNGLLIWAAWEAFDHDQHVVGGLLCFLETGWYVGNIYNAVNSTHQYNRRLETTFFDRIQLRCAPPFRDERAARAPCFSLHYALSF